MNSSDLKYLIRSKSFKFMDNKNNKLHSSQVYNYMGNNIRYRASTSDMILIYEILLKNGYDSEYWLPKSFQPKHILDIGANIGITSILFSNKYPESIIHAFEPLPANFSLLQENTKPYNNVTCHPYGLGVEDATASLFTSSDSENFGGGSIYNKLGVDENLSVEIKIKNAQSYLSPLLTSPPDLIKIDTEGAEHDILTAFDKDMLSKTKWITGELHGNNDFDLLQYLSNIGFNIKINKEIDNRLCIFHAISDQELKGLSKEEIKQLNKK